MKSLHLISFSFTLMFALTLKADAEPIVLQSLENQTALLELFTSEGCSSCPPAEQWFSGLKAAPGLWKEFVPVAFHVDYWDYLGWPDPWGSKAFSDRQRQYAEHWRNDSIYTPGFVLNGQEWRAWSVQKEGPRASSSKSGVLKAQSPDSEHWIVSFSPARQDASHFEVHAAVLATDLVSDVKAGENRGRRLNHDFVVISLTTRPLTRQNDAFHTEFTIKADKHTSKRLALALWVTPVENLKPVQALGGWLSN